MREENKAMIITGLRKRGYSINSINDLMRLSSKERELIPFLSGLLEQFTDENDKEFIVRCLGVKGFQEIIPKLLEEFKTAKGNSHRWAIANSINIIHDMTIEQELITLSENKKYGTGRQMLVLSLGCYKTDSSIKCLRGLLQDEEVRGHALRALGKCGNSEVLPDIQKYCDSDNRWIRKEALNAADKIRRRENDYGHIRQI